MNPSEQTLKPDTLVFSFRVPAQLVAQVQALAVRDMKSTAATMRRLIAAGLQQELQTRG
jgi:hypothetical protein